MLKFGMLTPIKELVSAQPYSKTPIKPPTMKSVVRQVCLSAHLF